MGMPERVLVCVDGSPAGIEAARTAIAFCQAWGVGLRAICVVRDSLMARALDAATDASLEPAAGRIVAEGHNLLRFVQDLARPQGVVVEVQLLDGDAVEEILRDAAEHHPDLVVMGRARRAGPGPVIVGSVTEHVLEFAEWPVLVVPAPAARTGARSGG